MPTPSDIAFSCACGAVSGTLLEAGPSQGDHVVCHCTDCQDFGRYLGKSERIVGVAGGTPLYQCRCARMRMQTGRDKLACLHLTDKPTLRWYAACCRTPMFNTYANGRVPYVTAMVGNCDPNRREAVFGPPIGHLFTGDATGDVGDVPKMSMTRMVGRSMRRIVKDVVSGDRRRSELFDGQTLQPIATPHRLTARERQDLAEK
ncbi:DUF6151 family protein [Qipengyuania zhejiangensis]|uniref:DUF6151 family protein n=1 Tax=Qipengyuania zhejiangensis TaxID=3077782 RepID=UPI002D77F84A|nr:DUF6151 family protein [Qipengyuania sp. Z2]